jgi:hypothetical protein
MTKVIQLAMIPMNSGALRRIGTRHPYSVPYPFPPLGIVMSFNLFAWSPVEFLDRLGSDRRKEVD